MTDSSRYVATAAIRAAVAGHELEILAQLGVPWRGGKGHITCPYPDHGGANDWRWDAKEGRAFCTCIGRRPGEKGAHSIFDVVACLDGGGFENAKIRVAEMLGRTDLIRRAGDPGNAPYTRTDAAGLLTPPPALACPSLPVAYLAHRLGIPPAMVPIPRTPTAGWSALGYFDPAPEAGIKPVRIGDFPCAVFGTLGSDGKTHAQRIYVAPGGAGKAELGKNAHGDVRDTKKAARVIGQDNTAGRCVLWGAYETALCLIIAEGIETAAAIAFAFTTEIGAGTVAVAAAITAGGVEAVTPWPATNTITVAADRDEAPKTPGKPASRRGERAARVLAQRVGGRIPVSMALPGLPGQSIDWLDVLRQTGAEAVREGIGAAMLIMPEADPVPGMPREVLRPKPSSEEPWPAPLDLFGDTTLAGEPPLPDGCLPTVIEAFARDEAERLGVVPEMVALPSLIVAAAAIEDRWQIQPKRYDTRWKESPRLWGAIVGDPSILKTPAIQAALEPLRAVEAEWIHSDAAALEEYQVADRVYTKALERYASKRARGEEGLSLPEKPPRPRIRRRIVGDVTLEKLADILVDNPGGVLSVRDELSGWFGSFDVYRDKGSAKDRADWLELYQGGNHPIDRVKRGTILVPNWSASLIGGIQPGPMRRLVGKIHDDGLVQRFMMIHGRRDGRGQDRAPNHRAIAGFKQTITQLIALAPPEEAGPLIFSDTAQEERQLVENTAENVMLLPETSAAMKAHFGKWSGLFARLALTFHLVEAASTGQTPAPAIPGETAAKVARFMLDFLLPNAIRFYVETLGQHDHLQHARWVAGYLLAKGSEHVTARDLYRASRELRDHPELIEQTMGVLDIAGWVSPKDDSRGRGVSKWRVNPLIHELFTQRAASERQRRAAIKAKIREAARSLGLAPDDCEAA